jgi:hypothetical protein
VFRVLVLKVLKVLLVLLAAAVGQRTLLLAVRELQLLEQIKLHIFAHQQH